MLRRCFGKFGRYYEVATDDQNRADNFSRHYQAAVRSSTKATARLAVISLDPPPLQPVLPQSRGYSEPGE